LNSLELVLRVEGHNHLIIMGGYMHGFESYPVHLHYYFKRMSICTMTRVYLHYELHNHYTQP